MSEFDGDRMGRWWRAEEEEPGRRPSEALDRAVLQADRSLEGYRQRWGASADPREIDEEPEGSLLEASFSTLPVGVIGPPAVHQAQCT